MSKIIKRLYNDINEITGLYESAAPDPYYFLSPTVVRSDLNRESYKSIMRPTKRRRVGGLARRPMRRTVKRRFKRRVKRMSWKKKAVMRTGQTLTRRTPCKERVVNRADNNVLEDNVPTVYNICQLGSAGVERNDRQTDEVNLRGFRLYAYVRAGKANELNVFNMAVVSPISPKAITDSGSFSLTDFFRGMGTERGTDFSNSSSVSRSHYPLNTDRWAVLWRKQYYLHRNGRDREWRVIKKYWKINREYRFEDRSATVPAGNNLFLVVWPTDMDGSTEIGTQGNTLTFTMRLITVFKETH